MAAEHEDLQKALEDVVRAQRLLEAFYLRSRSLLRAVEVSLLEAEPSLQAVRCPGYEIYSPTSLALDHPQGWLRRWYALFFAEPHFLGPAGVPAGADLKLAYLLFNLDPDAVAAAELDLVLLHDFVGFSGRVQGWLEAIWQRGLFDLDVPADGWYGRPEPVTLAPGTTMRLQMRRVPLSDLTDAAAVERNVVQRLLERYRAPAGSDEAEAP